MTIHSGNHGVIYDSNKADLKIVNEKVLKQAGPRKLRGDTADERKMPLGFEQITSYAGHVTALYFTLNVYFIIIAGYIFNKVSLQCYQRHIALLLQ